MTKWADWVITKKRMNATRTHIDKLIARRDLDTSLGDEQAVTRSQVVHAIQVNNQTVVTAYIKNGSYQIGETVYVIRINNMDFLKTVADGIARDNLDKLPDF